jgi:uncharacterized protein
MSPLIRTVLHAWRQALELRFGLRVRKVCLFGSWARGEAHEHSDVDLAAVIDGLQPEEWAEAVRLGAEVEVTYGLPISPFVVSSQRFEDLVRSGGIGAAIEREGVSP